MPTSPVPTRHRALLPPTRPPPARRERCHRSHLATSPSLCESPVLAASCRAHGAHRRTRRLSRCSVGTASPCPFPNQHACHHQAHITRRTPSRCPPSPRRFRHPVTHAPRHAAADVSARPGAAHRHQRRRSPSAPRAHSTSQLVKSVDCRQHASVRSRSAPPQPVLPEATLHLACA
jgi:hypothetical protein